MQGKTQKWIKLTNPMDYDDPDDAPDMLIQIDLDAEYRAAFERKMWAKDHSPLDSRFGWIDELEAYTEIMKQSTRYIAVIESVYSRTHFDDIETVHQPEYTITHRDGSETLVKAISYRAAKKDARRGLWVQYNGETFPAVVKKWFNHDGLVASTRAFLEAETPQGTILVISPCNG